ncbi:MAG: radical SAM protein, partial [Oscillospiraceae bacterium]|nr:radical SAM protein [Oscillospiraceae bacterium]
NGFINPEPLSEILPFIDAMNIDLKAFTADFYKKICGDLETVKSTIVAANRSCHVEISTLIIPGENDSDEEITAIAKWISSVDKDIPWHISRYFPRHEYTVPATEPATIYRLAEIAWGHLNYVYEGNL